MSDDIDIVLAPKVRSILLHKVDIPPDGVAALLEIGVVCIKVENLGDVQMMPVPLVVSFEPPVIKATEAIALQVIDEYRANSPQSVRSMFGEKMIRMLRGTKKP